MTADHRAYHFDKPLNKEVESVSHMELKVTVGYDICFEDAFHDSTVKVKVDTFHEIMVTVRW